jgi:hypothetical protein
MYLKWQRDIYTPHQAVYFGTNFERLMYINGSRCLEQFETLLIESTGIPLGFEGIGGVQR